MRLSAIIALLFGLGCGGAGDDDPIDESLIDITVEVRDLGAPVSGADVVFHRADGTVVSHVTTGADGTATGDGVNGGMVSAFSFARNFRRVITVADVDDRATVLLDFPDVWGTTWDEHDLGDIVGTIEVELPPLPDVAYYELFFGCTTETTWTAVTQIELPERCVGADDLVDIQATAWFNGKPLYPDGFTYTASVPFVRGGLSQVTLPAWDTQTYATTSFDLTNAPAGSVTMRVSGGLRADSLPFFGSVANGVASAVIDEGDSAVLNLDYLADFGDGLDITVAIEHLTGRTHWTAVDHERTDALALDLSADLLPAILDYQIDADTDVARPRLDWQAGDSLADADGLFVSMRWLLSDSDLYWVMLTAPDSPETATFPELPDALAAYLPPHPDDYDDPVFYQGMYAVDADWVSGFEDMKSYSLGFLTHPTLPTGKHVVRYTYGGASYLRTWVGRISD